MASLVRGAGDLRHRVKLEAREMVRDSLGNWVPGGDWVVRNTVYASLVALNGSEAAIHARIEGRQPYTLTIRYSALALGIDEHWRVRDARNESRVFAITTPPVDPDGRRAFVQMTLVEGQVS